MLGKVESIVMIRDSFYVTAGEPKEVIQQEKPVLTASYDYGVQWVRMLSEDATYNIGDAEGEVPPCIAFNLLATTDAAPHVVDGKLWDTKEDKP